MKTSVPLVKLGELIERCDECNVLNTYKKESVRGISINKKTIPTKADLTDVSLDGYKLFHPDEFCFVTITSRNGGKISLACNESRETYIVSGIYEVFRVTSELLLPAYLNLLFRRPEFDRYARFHSWGSAREAFTYSDMCRVEIPLPSIEVQREMVDAWQGLRKVKEENEQLAAPLLQLCKSYLQDCKQKYPMVELGPMIEERNVRNEDDLIRNVRGMSTTKEFRVPQSRVDFGKLSNYKIVVKNEFVFVPTTDTWRCLAICLSQEEEPFVVSPIYIVFSLTSDLIISEFLHLWCKRGEFDRYARYHSWGSARENFSYADMCRVKIPLPPIEVQQAVVEVYKCAMEVKRLAEEADRVSREMCSPLIQSVIRKE